MRTCAPFLTLLLGTLLSPLASASPGWEAVTPGGGGKNMDAVYHEDAAGNQVIAVAMDTGLIAISLDGGESFERKHDGLRSEEIYDLEFDSQGVLYVASQGGLYVSDDYGETFTSIGDDIPATAHYAEGGACHWCRDTASA